MVASMMSSRRRSRAMRWSVKNPFRKDTWNITEQMKLMKSDPQLAARLKAAV